MTRFIFASVVAVEADTLEAAYALIEGQWEDDGAWREIADHVEVFAPGSEPDDVEEPGDNEPACTCPPALAAAGGFTSTCHAAHGAFA